MTHVARMGRISSDAVATGSNAVATVSGGNAEAQAVGVGDIASIFNTGSAFDQAIAGSSSVPFSDNNLAEVIGTGSSALAGDGNDWDLAAALGNMLDAHATGANFLLDILTPFFSL